MIEEFKKYNFLFETDVNLKNYNTMKLESMCYVLVHPKDIQELKSIVDIIKKYKTKFFVLGNGSNVILPEYYDGVIIKLDHLKKLLVKNENIYVESGYMLNKLANKLSSLGYTGIEWATGIPGTIGGAVYSNAGAYNSSMNDIVDSVIVFDGNKTLEFTKDDLKFGYRTSVFKSNHELIVLSCNIKLNKGNLEEIKDTIDKRTKKRLDSQPLNYPSCGSVFRNPDNNSAWQLIDGVGLKGYNIGDALISNKHANFIVNNGNATSKDVIKLIKLIKKEVKKKYDIDLILEQEIIK
jgi:UDP-N-acetylmuramate dehydrogenase